MTELFDNFQTHIFKIIKFLFFFLYFDMPLLFSDTCMEFLFCCCWDNAIILKSFHRLFYFKFFFPTYVSDFFAIFWCCCFRSSGKQVFDVNFSVICVFLNNFWWGFDGNNRSTILWTFVEYFKSILEDLEVVGWYEELSKTFEWGRGKLMRKYE